MLRDERGKDPKELAVKELKSEAERALLGVEQEEYVWLEIKTEMRTGKVISGRRSSELATDDKP
jgi:hypothetical protein